MERPPRDIDEPRLLTLRNDTARFMSDNNSQAGYDDYFHTCCNAFSDSCANTAIGEGLDALSAEIPLSPEHASAVALIVAGHRTHASTHESARTRLGVFRLTRGGQTISDSDRVFAEITHELFCRPRPTTVSGKLDALRQAFVGRTLEVNIHAARKATAGVAFAKYTRDMSPGRDAKPKKAAADKRKATTAATTCIIIPGTKPNDATKLPTKK
jgi:hypothetical protein